MKTGAGDDTRHLTISAAARLGQINRASSILLVSIAVACAALVAWASVAEIDTVAQSQGKVIPSARVQLVQSLEGGIVTQIHVRQGQAVEKDSPLVTLSPMQASGDFKSRKQQTLALRARIARLQAEAEGRAVIFGDELLQLAPEFVRVEQASVEARRADLAAQVATLTAQMEQRLKEQEEARVVMLTARRTLANVREEQSMVEKLVAQGLEPRIELVRIERLAGDAQGREQAAQVAIERLQQAIAETRSRRDSALHSFRTQAREELNRAITELRTIEHILPHLEDRVDRTELRAPVRGVVNRVLVNTLGGVARPGDALIELVPADDQLVVEALVNPRDIGFISTGQEARVKLTAYDYAIYGALSGTVVQVGADAVTNERGESNYLVRVETKTKLVESLDRQMPIISGMQAQVDIITGKKTVMTYLLKPLIAVRENAFRER